MVDLHYLCLTGALRFRRSCCSLQVLPRNDRLERLESYWEILGR